jgi:Na+-translocating ferredoxin:NAD+ oxidoreductase RnfG subunit
MQNQIETYRPDRKGNHHMTQPRTGSGRFTKDYTRVLILALLCAVCTLFVMNLVTFWAMQELKEENAIRLEQFSDAIVEQQGKAYDAIMDATLRRISDIERDKIELINAAYNGNQNAVEFFENAQASIRQVMREVTN